MMKHYKERTKRTSINLDEILKPIPCFGYSYSVSEKPFCNSQFCNYHILYNYIKPRLSTIFIPDILKGQNDREELIEPNSPRFKSIDELIRILLEDAPCKTNESKLTDNITEYNRFLKLYGVFGCGIDADPFDLKKYYKCDVNTLYNHIVNTFSETIVKFNAWNSEVIAQRGTDLCLWFYNVICFYYRKYKKFPSERIHTIQFCEALYNIVIKVLEVAIGFNPTWLD